MTSTKTYLTNFFKEKEVPFQSFKIEDKTNTVHFLDTDVIIESIMNTNETEQNQIANILRRIDFKNGSVSHFLKYLAHGLVQQQAA